MAATSLGLDGLSDVDSVDRFEFHADKRVYKVLSKTNYHEVQVDGVTAKVLSVGRRNDQLFEDIHDMSIFHPVLRTTVAPLMALILLTLGISGVAMYLVPVIRRRRYRRDQLARSLDRE